LEIRELTGILNVKTTYESHGFEGHGNAAKAAFILMGRLLNPRQLAVSHPPCAIGEPSEEPDSISRGKT
jgi:hypothetical protein